MSHDRRFFLSTVVAIVGLPVAPISVDAALHTGVGGGYVGGIEAVVVGTSTTSDDPEGDVETISMISAQLIDWGGPGMPANDPLEPAEADLPFTPQAVSFESNPYGCVTGWYEGYGKHQKKLWSDGEWHDIGSGFSYGGFYVHMCP